MSAADTPAPLDYGVRLLSLYADAHAVYELLVQAGDEQLAVQYLARVINMLEHAHRSLYDRQGTAIVMPGQAEPM